MDRKRQTDYKRKLNAEAYDRLCPFVPKGRKAEIQAAAGETLHEYNARAIDQRMERESHEE